MRIVICGDTHGRLDSLNKELDNLKGADMFLHTGDFYRDGIELGRRLGIRTLVVAGNCDVGMSEPAEEIFEAEGHKLLLTHGHLYRVKNHLIALKLRAKEVGADIVIFGHTHDPFWENVDGVWYLNPGSLSLPRLHQYGTYALLDVEGDSVEARFVKVR